MRPYYEDGLVTIYHADCREWMPAADVIVTDPPYGTGSAGMVGDDAFPFDLLPGQGPCIAFGSARRHVEDLRSFALPPDRVMVWAPALNISKASEGGMLYKWMPIYGWGLRPVAMREPPYGDVFTDYIPFVSTISKPEPLMRHLVRLTEGVVLDPFMGRGSTLAAAKSLGRKAIGIEIRESACEIAAQRCSQEVLGLAL